MSLLHPEWCPVGNVPLTNRHPERSVHSRAFRGPHLRAAVARKWAGLRVGPEGSAPLHHRPNHLSSLPSTRRVGLGFTPPSLEASACEAGRVGKSKNGRSPSGATLTKARS